MPPTIISSEANRSWFKSPLSNIAPTYGDRRSVSDQIMCSNSSVEIFSKTIYPESVADKEGMPLICSGYLPYKPSRTYWSKPQRPLNISRTPDTTQSTNKIDLSTNSSDYLNSDNCLPRIIKPRKRRKKDRKPGGINLTPVPLTNNSVSTPSPSTSSFSASINEKKLPDRTSQSCFDSAHKLDENGGPVPQNVVLGMKVAFCRPPTEERTFKNDSANSFESTNVICKSLSNFLSETTTQTASSRNENFYEDEGEQKVENSSDRNVFCNCKYCDPERDIWDVRRRCYSPNLMTPQTVVDTGNSTQKTNTVKTCSTINLRRSSSEPTSKPLTTPVVTRVRSFSSSCDRGSQNLLVSSQIVTSHDGNRDIEIKFFSLSTSSSSSSPHHLPSSSN